MFTTHTFLARRKPKTVRVYTMALTRFAASVGSDMDSLHKYLETSDKEKLTGDLITFADSLKGKPNTQRVQVAAVLSYLSYNDITVPKSKRTQITPPRGDPFPDKALSVVEVKRVYEYLSPIGRAILLLLFTTGMRIGEVIQVKESDMEGRIIHLKGSYTKTRKPRDVVMSAECHQYLTTVWLPQKEAYLKSAWKRNKGLVNQTRPELRAKEKKLVDDRIIPVSMATSYQMLIRAFDNAGFGEMKDGKNVYHPHGLRKSFRSIVGSVNPDLAERLMGHAGYLSENYVRFDDLQKEYDKVQHLLSLSADPNMSNRVKALEDENAALKQEMDAVKQMHTKRQWLESTPEFQRAFEAAMAAIKASSK